MRGALRPKSKEGTSEEAEITLDLPPIPVPDPIGTQETEESEVETPVESNTGTETPAATFEPDLVEAPTRPSRVTKKPIRFNDYECYPCDSGLQTSREVTSQRSSEIRPAWNRPEVIPQTGQPRGGTESKEVVGDNLLWTTPTYIREDADRLCLQEWPELPQKRQDTRGPARSRPPGLPLETP